MLSYLSDFGNGQMLVLNLADHCYPPSGGCKSLSADIESCQSNGVKLFLSIGGWPNFSNYSLGSVEDAQNLTNYLWENFLGGQSNSRPLGDVILDDIDFDIRTTTGFSTSLRAYANGYITVVVLIFEVLPEIKTSSKYGGVMLWDNYYDKIANYSLIIKESLIMKLFPIDGPTLAAFSE
ncbi:hypothetical protein SUGI_0383560 [Cryptomeria japonica]|nr:hypothetical protein SUGI_0383560 [Cryptomeria japonica]